ncbi:MAG: dihydroxyacetone kinase subunit L [Candidatus Caldatribacterium sp.]|nr:dihydroxyacetone kinase subunit L [Candidatus Caldatribacterium sp.]
MYDTLLPALEALKKAKEEGKSLKEALESAIRAAREGMESTKGMLAKRGRSSRLGERSIGHIDPGAASSYFIIEAWFRALAGV